MKRAMIALALLASPASASWWSYHTLIPWLPVCPPSVEVEGSGGICYFDDDETPYSSDRPPEVLPLARATVERCEYGPLHDVEPGHYFVFVTDDLALAACIAPHTSPGKDLTVILTTRAAVFSDDFESGGTGAWTMAAGE